MPRSPLSQPTILVFDSGLGGLSIVGELSRAKLGARIVYLADTAFFPYGEKEDVVLLARLPGLVRTGANHAHADLVIIACNTASTLALEAIRAALTIPVIGVVPAIKPAAKLTNTGTIGLLATPNTVARPYTDKLIADFANGVAVVRHGAVGLAGAVEAMLCGHALDQDVIAAAMRGLFDQKRGAAIDVVVLACTHYPHVQAQLAAFAPRTVEWVDSGAAIARRAQSVLGVDGFASTTLDLAFTTGGKDDATRHGLTLWGFETTSRLPS